MFASMKTNLIDLILCFTISLTFQRAIVWDVKKGKKHAELGWESPAGVKYCFKVEKVIGTHLEKSSHTIHIDSLLAIIYILLRGSSLVVWRGTRGSTRCTPSAIQSGRARWDKN